jgi:LysR family transcriptional activator of nhaA
LEEWFSVQDIAPKIVGELDDLALAKVLGEAGIGIFAVADVAEEDVRRRYQVQVVGRAQALRQRFYAISVERKLQHPAVVAICEAARKRIFV